MARLLTPPSFYGTKYGLCTYHMYDNDYVRTASSLTAERVKEDPAFKNTRAWAAMMVQASGLAAAVYAMLPDYRKKHPLYRKLTGHAMRLLKQGRQEGEIIVELMLFINPLVKKTTKEKAGRRSKRQNKNSFPPARLFVFQTNGQYQLPPLTFKLAAASLFLPGLWMATG